MTATHTILIVDDDSIMRDTFIALLEKQDAHLYVSENGQDALKLAAEIQPDLILLDVMMPGMDGFEVCRQLRANSILAEVSIVMITALDDRDSRLRGLQAGADDFLTKPIDQSELHTRVQTILRLNRYRKLLEERTRFAEVLEGKNHQLRELTQHLIEIQETERRYIATELHDDVSQILTGLKLMIEMAASQTNDELQDTLEHAKNTVSDLSVSIRNLSLDLRPAMLDDFGLFAALEWQFERYTKQTRIRVKHNFSFMDERRFPKAIETAAYRIIQESLTNAARHADSADLEVNIQVDGTLNVEISDHGKGFDTTAINDKAYKSGGLSGMRERVSLLGGEFSIVSSPGNGTTVIANFALEEDSPHA